MTSTKAPIIAACITATATIAAAIIAGGIGYFKNPTSTPSIYDNIKVGTHYILTGKIPTATGSSTADTAQSQKKKVDLPSSTLGYLAQNVGLLDNATWTSGPAPADRTLNIDCRIVAQASGAGTARVTGKIIDGEKTVACSVSANSQSSTKDGTVFKNDAHTSYYLAANKSITLKSEVTVENAKVVALDISVYALSR